MPLNNGNSTCNGIFRYFSVLLQFVHCTEAFHYLGVHCSDALLYYKFQYSMYYHFESRCINVDFLFLQNSQRVSAHLKHLDLFKVSNGMCDNLLTCVLRAWDLKNKKVLFAPAMNTLMWDHPITQVRLTDYLFENQATRHFSLSFLSGKVIITYSNAKGFLKGIFK